MAAIERFRDAPPRGEMTLVIEGYTPAVEAHGADAGAPDWRPAARERLLALRAEGVSGSTAAKQVARDLKQPRGKVYALWTDLPETE